MPPTKQALPDPTAAPVIPLSETAQAAYQDLYDKLQTEIENTADPIALVTLNDSRTAIDDVLTKNNIYRLHANTIKFSEVFDQIKQSNKQLAVLKARISDVATHIATAAQIIASIDKILKIVPIS